MDPVYFLSDFPEQLAPVWSFLPCGDGDSYGPGKLLEMDGSQVQNLQKSVNAYASEFDIISKLLLVGNDFHVARQKKPLAQPGSGKSKAKKDSQTGVVESSMGSNSLVTMRIVDKKTPRLMTPRKGEGPKTPAKVSLGLRSALKKSQPVSILPPDSPLAKARIVGTASRKLTYLMNKIVEHHKTEKTLIFFEDGGVAWYIAQALEILGIENLWYSGGLTQERRATHLSAFQNSEKYRVLLMDLRQAAHGLNVSCASRIFFINPVWRRDIEQQAMKRAHRIGQTRTVYVETLILVDTIEEAMWKRRGVMTEKERDGAKGGLIEDSKMRDIILNLKFLEVEPNEIVGVQQVSILAAPEPIFGDGKHGGVYNEIEHTRLSSISTSSTVERVTSDLPTVSDELVKSDLMKVHWVDETSSRKRKSLVAFPVAVTLIESPPALPGPGSSRSTKRKKKLGFKAGDNRDWMEDSDDDFRAPIGDADGRKRGVHFQ